MNQRQLASAEAPAFAERTRAARASIEAGRADREGPGAAVMVAAMAFGRAVEDGGLRRLAGLARAFCIICAGVIPVALFWTQVYPG